MTGRRTPGGFAILVWNLTHRLDERTLHDLPRKLRIAIIVAMFLLQVFPFNNEWHHLAIDEATYFGFPAPYLQFLKGHFAQATPHETQIQRYFHPSYLFLNILVGIGAYSLIGFVYEKVKALLASYPGYIMGRSEISRVFACSPMLTRVWPPPPDRRDGDRVSGFEGALAGAGRRGLFSHQVEFPPVQ